MGFSYQLKKIALLASVLTAFLPTGGAFAAYGGSFFINIQNLTDLTWYPYGGCFAKASTGMGVSGTYYGSAKSGGSSPNQPAPIPPNKYLTFQTAGNGASMSLSSISCTFLGGKDVSSATSMPDPSNGVLLEFTANVRTDPNDPYNFAIDFEPTSSDSVTAGETYFHFCPITSAGKTSMYTALTNPGGSVTNVTWDSQAPLTPGEGQKMANSLGKRLKDSLSGIKDFSASYDPNAEGSSNLGYGVFNLAFRTECPDGEEYCGDPYFGAMQCSTLPV